MRRTTPPSVLLRADRWAMLGAAVAQGWLTIRLGRRIEPPAGWNPRLDALGPAGGLALSAAAIAALVVGGLVLREAIRSRRHADAPAASRARMVVLGLVMMAMSVALASPMGPLSAVIAAMAATGACFHLIAGRFIPPIGIITLALLMALIMAVPNPRLTFAYPLMLTLLHLTIVGATHERFAARGPAMRPADWVALGAGWVFWTLGLTVLMSSRNAGEGGALGHAPDLLQRVWVGPMLSFIVFLPCLAWAVRRAGGRTTRSRRVWWIGGLGLTAHNAAWLIGIGDAACAGLLAAAALPAVVLTLLGHAGRSGDKPPPAQTPAR